MSTRSVLFASVCIAFLAASVAVPGQAFAAAPSSSKLVTQAYKAMQAGDSVAAVEAYNKAIESRELAAEVLANALLNRGLAFQRLNEHTRAIDDYTSALRIDAMSGKLRAMALYNRGLSHQKLGQPSRGIEDFTSALFLDSRFAHAYFSRGLLLRDSGQYLFALADFDKAIRFKHPEPARVHFAEAMAYEKLRRPQNARDALTKALAANASYEPARHRLAVLDGKIVPAAAPADEIATATIQNVAALPAAEEPKIIAASASAADTPVVEVASTSRKRYTDRVPTEARPVKVAALDNAEEIVAVDTVPEETPPAATDASAAEEPEAAASTPEPSTLSGWSVQLASAASEDAAWSTWKKMKARNKALAKQEPVVVKADLGAKGVFYRVRLVGYDSQDDAKSACSKLRTRGVKCFISKAAS